MGERTGKAKDMGGVHHFINCLKCSGEDLSLQKKSNQYLLRGPQGCWRGELDSAALTLQHRSVARQEGLCRGVRTGVRRAPEGMCLSGVMHSNCRGTFYTLLFIFYLLLLDKYAIKQLADPSMWGRARGTAGEQNLWHPNEQRAKADCGFFWFKTQSQALMSYSCESLGESKSVRLISGNVLNFSS